MRLLTAAEDALFARLPATPAAPDVGGGLDDSSGESAGEASDADAEEHCEADVEELGEDCEVDPPCEDTLVAEDLSEHPGRAEGSSAEVEPFLETALHLAEGSGVTDAGQGPEEMEHASESAGSSADRCLVGFGAEGLGIGLGPLGDTQVESPDRDVVELSSSPSATGSPLARYLTSRR